MSKSRKTASMSIADFARAMERVAPVALAQDWDNVGLLLGDRAAALHRALFAIDLTPPVAKEAIRKKADLLFCYHPPIFKPISSLTGPGHGMESLVLDCARMGIAIYSSHTALDAAKGGTNDVIADLCDIEKTEPLEYTDAPGENKVKLVVFVPSENANAVAQAAFGTGAGVIGDYTHCSYRSDGTGSFFGTDATNPAVGRRGRLEFVSELRLEIVVPASALPKVVDAIKSAHPYEEPAFDIYPTLPPPVRGIGRIGPLPKGTTLASLARKLARATEAPVPSIVGTTRTPLRRAIIIAGAAGSLPFRAGLSRSDVVITGEIRHHDALAIQRSGASAIALGHWSSERPVLKSLIRSLKPLLPGVSLAPSKADAEPFAARP